MTPHPSFADLQRTFVSPAGLGSSRPRDVRLTGAGRAVMVIAVALFAGAVVAGVLLSQTAARQAADRRALLADGLDTQGTVVRLWQTSGEKERRMSYRYSVDGRNYQSQMKIPSSTWRTLQVGAPVAVRYLAADPGRSTAAGVQPGAIPPWLPFVVAGALAIAGGLCLYLIGLQRRLLMDGRAAPAIVTGHAKHSTPHGGTQRTMKYTFPLLSGATAEGKSATSRKPPAIGSVICVLYDPERPRRSMPYPLQFVRPGRG